MGEHTWVIYGLRLVDDSEYRYVGLTTVGPTLRLKRHYHDANRQDRRVSRWIRKNHGKIAIDVLEECPVGDKPSLGESEQYWIGQIRSFGHRLTNQSDGGESGSYGARWTLRPDQIRTGPNHPNYGVPLSEETKELLSKAKLGTVRSEESRKKQGASIAGEKHWAFGTTRSEEYRSKISATLTGRKFSDERRQQMSLSMQGNRLPVGAGDKGRHTRWHTNKNLSKPESCSYCKEEIESSKGYQLEQG